MNISLYDSHMSKGFLLELLSNNEAEYRIERKTEIAIEFAPSCSEREREEIVARITPHAVDTAKLRNRN